MHRAVGSNHLPHRWRHSLLAIRTVQSATAVFTSSHPYRFNCWTMRFSHQRTVHSCKSMVDSHRASRMASEDGRMSACNESSEFTTLKTPADDEIPWISGRDEQDARRNEPCHSTSSRTTRMEPLVRSSEHAAIGANAVADSACFLPAAGSAGLWNPQASRASPAAPAGKLQWIGPPKAARRRSGSTNFSMIRCLTSLIRQ